ncbi:MAG: acyltransferase [Bacteroidaceae bacterium]|nr:acyltransferase [Bacteroidaceae bacterium]
MHLKNKAGYFLTFTYQAFRQFFTKFVVELSIYMESKIDWSRNQSQAIDLLRFPLMIMVVFGHMMITTTAVDHAEFSLLSGQGIYNALCICFSYVVPHMTVPTFFIISGYLFFRNINVWSWQTYKEKIRKRFHSLLIPYILWNAIPVIINLVRYTIMAIADHSTGIVYEYVNGLSLWSIFFQNVKIPRPENILGWSNCFMDGPINGTLWFLQDLIVLCIISPVIYLLVRKTGLFIVSLFGASYLLDIYIPVPGLGFNGLFFFSVGAYFALNGKNICKFSREYVHLLIPASLVFCVLGVYYGGIYGTYGTFYTYIFTIFGSFLAFAIASSLIDKGRAKPNPFLVRCAFLIFVTNLINILDVGLVVQIFRDSLYAIIGADSYLQLGITYFLTPFVTAGTSILVCYLLERFLPKLTAISMGIRY